MILDVLTLLTGVPDLGGYLSPVDAHDPASGASRVRVSDVTPTIRARKEADRWRQTSRQ